MAKAAQRAASSVAGNTAKRAGPLDGRAKRTAVVSVEPAPPPTRISLRAGKDALPALSKALGLALPDRPKSSASKGSRTALWLGPDEWLVIDQAGHDMLADCAKVKALHSAVDISHRNIGVVVSGAAAADTINTGCPQDLSLAAFPVGAATRTVFGKIEIVLLRTAEDTFRVECWRSFSCYAFTFLADAARDAAA
jgi:sarcosine oxidase subunit gamma